MMPLKRRKLSTEFKLWVLREIEAGKTVAQTAREHQVHPTQINQWRRQRRQYGDRAFAGNGRAYTAARSIETAIRWLRLSSRGGSLGTVDWSTGRASAGMPALLRKVWKWPCSPSRWAR